MTKEIKPDAVMAAYNFGYHSERHIGQGCRQHKLADDAQDMAGALGRDDLQPAILNALVHGVKPQFMPGAEITLDAAANRGDIICIWTEGDTSSPARGGLPGSHAQLAKIRSLELERKLRNINKGENGGPNPAGGNFILYSADKDYRGVGKTALIPQIATYVGAVGCTRINFIDDSLGKIESARTVMSSSAEGMDTCLFWLDADNRGFPPGFDASGIIRITSLSEYNQYTSTFSGRQGHVMDLDGVIIDPLATEKSRKAAVVQAVTQNRSFAPAKKPSPHLIDGIYVWDSLPHGHDDKGNLATTDMFGHQADIHQVNGKLVKVYAASPSKRPDTTEWRLFRGYEGAQTLAATVKSYRHKLREIGFPVPTADESHVVVARNRNGDHVVAEIVKCLGRLNLQDELLAARTFEEKMPIIAQILEASLPVLLADNIGADLKPANWVRRSDTTLVHVDPLPVLLVDEDGRAITEWPPADAAKINDFLITTHMTPLAIGYRLFQELCQIDPANRSAYQRQLSAYGEMLVQTGVLPPETGEAIKDALNPATSIIAQNILSGNLTAAEGFCRISEQLDGLTKHNWPAIYHLREMAFLLSETAMRSGLSLRQITEEALRVVADRKLILPAKAEKLSAAIGNLPDELQFLSLVRKLTHLGGEIEPHEEMIAYEVIKAGITAHLSYVHNQTD